jgi:hypothetical protein
MGGIDSDTSEVVSSVTQAACCVVKLQITITCHEAHNWLEGGRINDDA